MAFPIFTEEAVKNPTLENTSFTPQKYALVRSLIQMDIPLAQFEEGLTSLVQFWEKYMTQKWKPLFERSLTELGIDEIDGPTLDLFMMRAHTSLVDLETASVETPIGSDTLLFAAALEEVIQLLVKKGPELKNFDRSSSRQSNPYTYYMQSHYLDAELEFDLDDIVEKYKYDETYREYIRAGGCPVLAV
eukprot:CFRG8229T1